MTWKEIEDFENGFCPARYDVYNLWGMAGVSSRTLHYYVHRRLIQPAIGSGTAARYTYEHVVRLRVIRILKKRRMTLREIGIFLDGFTLRELYSIAEGLDPMKAIRSVRRGLLRPGGSRPHGSEPFFRVIITTGIEIHVSPEYHARAVARSSDLIEAIAEILDVV
ncbi:MAG TPA: MerR family transcriptional regulator [Candidatus Binatia bacterium]|nr:MerR family transcriptional regulator [Candidatus Binatia bacterium]